MNYIPPEEHKLCTQPASVRRRVSERADVSTTLVNDSRVHFALRPR